MKNRLHPDLICLAMIYLLLLPFPVSATMYYVDAENGDDSADGLTWETACRTISRVCQMNPVAGDIIRVAEGVYPEYVEMIPGVEMQGGYCFGGTEPDPDLYVSIIDGENIRRCVNGAHDAVLAGFTLRNGRSSNGSGVLHNHITMHVRDCIIRDCVASAGNPNGGGGMYFYQSRSVIEDCLFENNAVDQDPGDTSGEIAGGAVMGWTAGPGFYRCTFRNNSVLNSPTGALRLGGAMWFAASDPTIRSCTFEGNSADSGGGAGWWNRSRPAVEDCLFLYNTADAFGGGICHIYNEVDEPDVRVAVRNCRFEGNTAGSGAGMTVMRNNDLLIENCQFVRNRALIAGSALTVDYRSRCMIRHCTIADNQQTDPITNTGAVEIDATSCISMHHSIVSANESQFGIMLEAGGDPLNQQITWCDVHGHNRNYSDNLVDRTGWCGNISVHPLFTYFNENPYRLSEPQTMDPLQIQLGRSPCIDAAGTVVNGYPVAYGSTRTDAIADRLQADMGFHQHIPGMRLIMDTPEAGDYGIALDTRIECRLLDPPDGITAGDIRFTLNALQVYPDCEQIPDGFSVVLQPQGGLQPNTDYWLEVTVEASPEDIVRTVKFSTAGPPDPEIPPAGNSLNLVFPMSQTVFGPGQDLDISLQIYNPWLNDVSGDIHVVFLFAGDFFIYPAWDRALHPVDMNCSPGTTRDLNVLAFTVPPGIGNLGPFDFFAVATQGPDFDLISQVASWSMYFSEQ